MKQEMLRTAFEAAFLRKRAIVESVIDQLKNISQVSHSRHRSPRNFIINLMGALLAYCLQPKKPSLNLDSSLFESLTVEF